MIEVKMPRLSDTMEEGAISTWRKQPGEQVAAGDVLVEIETDKAVMEYEAYQAGTLSQILVPEGQVAAIGATIALVDDGSGDAAAAAPQASAEPAPAAAGDSAPPAAAAGPDAAPAAAAPAGGEQSGANGDRVLASPLVRKLARENHLDLRGVAGTGPGGRIIRADLSGLLAAGSAPQGAAPAPHAAPAGQPHAPASAPAPAPGATAPAATQGAATQAAATQGTGPQGDELRGSRTVPVTTVRRVIARRLSASAREIPHYYVTAAADATGLLELRSTVNAQLAEHGPARGKVSVNDLLIRAVALALRAHPEVNVSYSGDDSPTMLVHDRVNIGVAVAAPSGLIVPVIVDADIKTVTQIGAESRALVALAGERKLSPAQLDGGTFTISNLGMYGVEDFTAIINPPQSAILAVGATTREPAVVGDQVLPRHKMRYTLSSDHRVIDGALAAQFLKTLTGLIENPWTIIA